MQQNLPQSVQPQGVQPQHMQRAAYAPSSPAYDRRVPLDSSE
jgi:hypothetical protein